MKTRSSPPAPLLPGKGNNFLSVLKINLFIYFWLRWVFVAARGLSLVAESGSYSLLVMRGLLIVVASVVVEHGRVGFSRCGTRAQ